MKLIALLLIAGMLFKVAPRLGPLIVIGILVQSMAETAAEIVHCIGEAITLLFM